MQNALVERARRLGRLLQQCFKDESGCLAQAAEKTISDRLFPEDDVHFALRHLQASTTTEHLAGWLEQLFQDDGFTAPTSAPERVLCLHAGNLPLVGFQDVAAVLLSGNEYHGKISSKDPYLLPALLDQLADSGAFGPLRYTTSFDTFAGLSADRVMFSGSGKNLQRIMQRLQDACMTHDKTAFLVRTAHTSAACIDPDAITQENLPAFFEALFQYQGKGCRSLNTIFTPRPEALLDIIRREQEQHFPAHPYTGTVISRETPSPEIHYLAAFNEAVQRPYARIGGFIVQISDPQPETERLISITRDGTMEKLNAFVEKSGADLQSVYTLGTKRGQHHKSVPFEPLKEAQRPPLCWTPDGTDPLRWLLTEQKASQPV